MSSSHARGYVLILGAGASSDSGLPLYRGEAVPASVEEILERSMAVSPGPTYQAMRRATPDALVLTQNVDRLSERAGLRTVALHLRFAARAVPLDQPLDPALVIRAGDLDNKVRDLAHRRLWDMHRRFGSRLVVAVVGTSSPWEYLRRLLDRATRRGAHIVHINPDPAYPVLRDGRTLPIVRDGEVWIRAPAAEGVPLLPFLKFERAT